MRKFLSYTLRVMLLVIALPVAYFFVSFILSYLTVERSQPLTPSNKNIYLHSNGLHLDIALNKKDLSPALLQDLKIRDGREFVSFGWGDKNFYLNTPEWSDLEAQAVVTALFINSDSLMHLTHYSKPQVEWIVVPVTNEEMMKINNYLLNSFKMDSNGHKVILNVAGYGTNDDFYEAKGGYNMFNTCNTWVNTGFKQSGLKASVWTPFDFGLMNKYE